jgi:hypothetical protein
MSFDQSAAAPGSDVKTSQGMVLFIACLTLFFLTCIFSVFCFGGIFASPARGKKV